MQAAIEPWNATFIEQQLSVDRYNDSMVHQQYMKFYDPGCCIIEGPQGVDQHWAVPSLTSEVISELMPLTDQAWVYAIFEYLKM